MDGSGARECAFAVTNEEVGHSLEEAMAGYSNVRF